MYYGFFIFVFLCCMKMKFSGKDFFADHLSREKISSLKGVCAVLLIFNKFCASFDKLPAGDKYIKSYMKWAGQLIIVLLLFFAGYELLEKIAAYEGRRPFAVPLKNTVRLLIDFEIAVLLCLGIALTFGKKYPLKTILLSFAGLSDVGNGAWLVFAVLCGYAFTFFAFLVCGKKKYAAAAAVTVLSAAYIVAARRFLPAYYSNVFVCYPLGVWYSLLRGKIEGFVGKNNVLWALSLLLCGGAFIVCHHFRGNFILSELHAVFFVLCVMIFTMKVSVNNKLLTRLGGLAFGVYVFEKIPLILMNGTDLMTAHRSLAFVIMLASCLVIAGVYGYERKLTEKLLKT